jgi:hypothetical protein
MSLAEYEAGASAPAAHVGPKAKKRGKSTTEPTVVTGGDTGESGAEGATVPTGKKTRQTKAENPPPPGHSPSPAPVGPARGQTHNRISYRSGAA